MKRYWMLAAGVVIGFAGHWAANLPGAAARQARALDAGAEPLVALRGPAVVKVDGQPNVYLHVHHVTVGMRATPPVPVPPGARACQIVWPERNVILGGTVTESP